jgi:hypothetical protein
LNFFPESHGQGSFLPVLSKSLFTTVCCLVDLLSSTTAGAFPIRVSADLFELIAEIAPEAISSVPEYWTFCD